MKGQLHPSLRAYVDCFLSPPFPKQFPRGGGVWDQDPILMRDFRAIRTFEREWKQVQEQAESMKSGGNGGGLGQEMQQYLENIGEDGTF